MRKRDEYVAFCLDETEDESVCSYYFLKLPMRLVQQPFCALRPRLRPSNECAPGVCVWGGEGMCMWVRARVCVGFRPEFKVSSRPALYVCSHIHTSDSVSENSLLTSDSMDASELSSV